MRAILIYLIPIVVAIVGYRFNELFALSIRHGQLLLVRGRVPPGLLDAFADIARTSRIERATVRAVRGMQHARLVIRGVDDGTAQRFRNVFGIHPVHELRAAPPVADRNFGQLLGWTWLAWLLLRR